MLTTMRAFVALGFALGGTALLAAETPQLRPLSTSDIDPAALEGPGCYLHQGENILLVGVRRNALLNLDDDLLLLHRSESGEVIDGAGYRGTGIAVEIAVNRASGEEIRQAGRLDRPADVTIRRSKQQHALQARWNCKV